MTSRCSGLFLALILVALLPTGCRGTKSVQTTAEDTVVDQVAVVRDLVSLLDTEAMDGSLARTERETAVCGGPGFSERMLYRDADLRERLYVLVGGSGDSTRVIKYYYDRGVQLRAVYVRSSAVNGTLQEERLYYDERGEQIHSEFEHVKGPGWSWGDVPIVLEPARDFDSEPACDSEEAVLLQVSGLN